MTKAEQLRLVTFRSKFLEHAKRCGNISATCRYFGISRQKFHKWKNGSNNMEQPGLRTRVEHHTAARTQDSLVNHGRPVAGPGAVLGRLELAMTKAEQLRLVTFRFGISREKFSSPNEDAAPASVC